MTSPASPSHTSTVARTVERVSVSQALREIPAGSVISASPYCASPTTLLRGLAQRSQEVAGLVLAAGLLLDGAPYSDAVLAGDLKYVSWHVSGPARALARAGAMDYLPIRALDVHHYLASHVNVALVRVTPPDAAGNVSLGPSASYTKDLLLSAELLIAEVDPLLPRTIGEDVTFAFNRFDLAVDAETPMSTYGAAKRTELNARVAAQVVPLIPDAAVVQLGIGGVPEAVAHHLAGSEVHELGLIGMLTDPMVELLVSGRMRHGQGAVTAVELLGSGAVFEHAHENHDVQMRSSTSVHHPAWLAQHQNLVSVCSALAIDLSGQVASEQIDGRTIAGVGGSADFFEGAHLSPQGVRVVALTSVTHTGDSRILAHFAPDTPVTLPRHSVDVVVTEYGAARLSGRSVQERAAALVAIAAPQHRDQLSAAAEQVTWRSS